MDRKFLRRAALPLIALTGLFVQGGCSKEEGNSFISFSLTSDYSYYSLHKLSERFKSSDSQLVLPDTNDFILSVFHENGTSIYEGPYEERPNPLQVSAGTYNVGLYSVDFPEPAFSSPQFGDTRSIVVADNENVSIAFGCTQLNCGLKLVFDESFRDKFFTYTPTVISDEGSLDYAYTETRTAFFHPGILKVVCTENDGQIPILTRQLNAADMLTIKLSASTESGDGSGFSIRIDTTRNWIYEDYMVGSGNDGSTMEKALTVADLGLYLGASDVWVKGYIVGGDLSTSNVNTSPPFSKESHLAIADKKAVSSRAECAGVEIPSREEIRNALNLVDNSGIVGRVLYIKGDIEQYFGHPGVKGISEYKLEE